MLKFGVSENFADAMDSSEGLELNHLDEPFVENNKKSRDCGNPTKWSSSKDPGFVNSPIY